jgi:hypothetical protein
MTTGTVSVDVSAMSSSSGETFLAGSGVDSFHGDNNSSSTIYVSTEALAQDTFNGGAGGLNIHLTDGGTVVDADFAHVTNIYGELYITDNTSVTLGSLADAAGLTAVRAEATTGAVSFDASALTDYSYFAAGSGYDTFIGGTGDNTVYVSIEAIGHDTLNGGAGASYAYISMSDAGTILDSAFAHVSNFPMMEVFDGSVTLGPLSQAAGLNEIDSGETTALTVDASARADSIIDNDLDGNGAATFIAGGGADIFYAGTGSDTVVAPSTAGSGLVTIQENVANVVNAAIELDASNGFTGLANDGGGNLAASSLAIAPSSISGTPQNLGGAVAGIVAVSDGGSGATLWYTTDLAAVTASNSHEFAHVNNVDTSHLENTQFHLHV